MLVQSEAPVPTASLHPCDQPHVTDGGSPKEVRGQLEAGLEVDQCTPVSGRDPRLTSGLDAELWDPWRNEVHTLQTLGTWPLLPEGGTLSPSTHFTGRQSEAGAELGGA